MRPMSKINLVTIAKYRLNGVQRKITGKGIWFKNHSFFNLEFVDNYLIIKKCYNEDSKKRLKMNPSTQIYFDIPYGNYEACEEESTDDELIIYIN